MTSKLPDEDIESAAADVSTLKKRGQGVQIVYDSLRQAILELTLEPGSPLDETRLADQFNLSRTPIREAMVRLSAEGLLLTLPNRNTIVAPIDFVNLPFYFEALTLMYRVTTRSAAVHRRPEHLIKIKSLEASYAASVARRDAIAMIATNRDFHVAIAEAGGNHYFTQLFARLLDEGRRVLRLYYQSFDDALPRQYVDEHSDMVAAIEAGDADTADALGAAHAAQIVRQIQTYIARDTASGIALGEVLR
ncbi:transcriptional regulator, GntR family [Devosia sp. YR412]|uniref:GntR family transcriptional regulator n=1 Tax=Devosia sp. YR412 TaxID=1881030 RepID=UPI0008D3C4FD|nr:GntR family transcriptional regulator [Devosia sp. YR412]SEQ56760.1 transcriptional regulator, GntR family [Devosia sp. YR412]